MQVQVQTHHHHNATLRLSRRLPSSVLCRSSYSHLTNRNIKNTKTESRLGIRRSLVLVGIIVDRRSVHIYGNISPSERNHCSPHYFPGIRSVSGSGRTRARPTLTFFRPLSRYWFRWPMQNAYKFHVAFLNAFKVATPAQKHNRQTDRGKY